MYQAVGRLIGYMVADGGVLPTILAPITYMLYLRTVQMK